MGLTKSFVKTKAASGLDAIRERRARIRGRLNGVSEPAESVSDESWRQALVPAELPKAARSAPVKKPRKTRIVLDELVSEAKAKVQDLEPAFDVPVTVDAKTDRHGNLTITLRIGIVERHY